MTHFAISNGYGVNGYAGGFNPCQGAGRIERLQFYSAVVSADYEKRNYARDVNQYTDVLYNLNNFNRYLFLLKHIHDVNFLIFCDIYLNVYVGLFYCVMFTMT